MNRRSFLLVALAAPLLAEEKPLELAGKLVALPDKQIGLKLQERSSTVGGALQSRQTRSPPAPATPT